MNILSTSFSLYREQPKVLRENKNICTILPLPVVQSTSGEQCIYKGQTQTFSLKHRSKHPLVIGHLGRNYCYPNKVELREQNVTNWVDSPETKLNKQTNSCEMQAWSTTFLLWFQLPDWESKNKCEIYSCNFKRIIFARLLIPPVYTWQKGLQVHCWNWIWNGALLKFLLLSRTALLGVFNIK